ncbi:MAG: hypothetical protein Q4E51_03975 [Lachnospiraceae bacterium]|nr:hypothetical protein [Lachnospiraceae bacterium]
MRGSVKRFFFNEKTYSIGIAMEAVLIFIVLFCDNRANVLDSFSLFELILRTALLIGLYRSYRHRNIYVMSGIASGLLFCILYREANHVLGELMTLSVDKFIMMGYKGSVYLCISMTILFLECVMIYNHFSINVKHINGLTKLAVNEASTIMLFIMFTIQIFSNFFLDLNFWVIASYVCTTFAEGVLFVVIGHCDLMTAIDMEV